MIESSLARNGYKASTRSISSDRALEYQVFSQVTNELTNARKDDHDYHAKLASALNKNMKLWTTLAGAVSDKSNQLPAQLRSSLFYLAEFTRHQTAKIYAGEATPDVLVDVNMAVMRGLRTQTENAGEQDMSGGLIIRLRPREKFLVNGVIIENGDKRATLRIKSDDANVLRLRDALHPSEADTPVKRLYYCAQLAVTGDAKPDEVKLELLRGLEALDDALPAADCRETIENAILLIHEGEYYRVMRLLRTLMPIEEKLLLLARTRSCAMASNAAAQ